VVEGARLESVYMGNCIKSSNLLLSAKWCKKLMLSAPFFLCFSPKKAIKAIQNLHVPVISISLLNHPKHLNPSLDFASRFVGLYNKQHRYTI
jgi:hypothetical protein